MIVRWSVNGSPSIASELVFFWDTFRCDSSRHEVYGYEFFQFFA